MKIAIAQTTPIKGNIAANIKVHKKLIELAITQQADAIFFSELSITGYEPLLVKDLATNENDERFEQFQILGNENNITIGIGVPIKVSAGIQIGLVFFQPNKLPQTYCKQHLHSDEFPYFVPEEKQIILNVGDKKIAPAICYESMLTHHAQKAHELGAQIYITSVAKTQDEVDRAKVHYPLIAKQFDMPVLMSNCFGQYDNFVSVGKSAVWNKQGNLIAQLNDKQEGILIFDTETENAKEYYLTK